MISRLVWLIASMRRSIGRLISTPPAMLSASARAIPQPMDVPEPRVDLQPLPDVAPDQETQPAGEPEYPRAAQIDARRAGRRIRARR